VAIEGNYERFSASAKNEIPIFKNDFWAYIFVLKKWLQGKEKFNYNNINIISQPSC
jgi:hypothetical protein